MNLPRAEYPRPQFVRPHWHCLNGEWEFAFDDDNRGLEKGWASGNRHLDRTILVPYPFESKLSGIGDTGGHDTVWYRRQFSVPGQWQSRRVYLHFGAVDYRCHIWLNGTLIGAHIGGHTPVRLEVTRFLRRELNTLVVRVKDPPTDPSIPRGKQSWKPQSEGIYYTRTTGIWQPVWLEAVADPHIVAVRILPDVDAMRARFDFDLRGAAQLRVKIGDREWTAAEGEKTVVADLRGAPLWTPENPHLLDVEFSFGEDHVQSYFGLRKVHTEGGKFFLNNKPYHQKLVLDQGYWPDGVLAAPSDEALKADIVWAKKFGFNGARKHQKVEDPRWLYWADTLGFLVWGEMANAHLFSADAAHRLLTEWQSVLARDFNHPCIVAWAPINESWGVPQIFEDPQQQAFVRALYWLTRSLDATRPVVDNDGWEHTEATDLFTVHDYEKSGAKFSERWAALAQDRKSLPEKVHRPLLVRGSDYRGQPLLLTEYGGIAYLPSFAQAPEKSWGYGGIEPDEKSFLARYRDITRAVMAHPAFHGFCYTQLADVEQEINGLLTCERKPKVDPALIAAIHAGA